VGGPAELAVRELAEYQPLLDNARKLRALLSELQDLTSGKLAATSPHGCPGHSIPARELARPLTTGTVSFMVATSIV
jgi:hypothetical protein